MAESTYIASGKVTVFEVLFSVFCLKIIFQLIFFFFFKYKRMSASKWSDWWKNKEPTEINYKKQ